MNIPAPYPVTFEHGIRHPELFLWDAWSYEEEAVYHLYCLAISRFKPDGTPLSPQERNNYPFHIRHFTSTDDAKTWDDRGCFLAPDSWPEQSNYHTVWSGSVERLSDGKILLAFTSLEVVNDNRRFLQNIALALSESGQQVDQMVNMALSAPVRDWEEITDKGYYLDTPEHLGSNQGEEEGPILAWRDPFIFIDSSQQINLFWGGKVTPRTGALVRALLERQEDGFKLSELFPAVTLPDGEQFTQLELPKVFHDPGNNIYYLMISSCNRLYEGQSDLEVDKGVRLYKSHDLNGPWISLGEKILNEERLFGPTVLRTDFDNNRWLCIAPYTDAVESGLSLSFAPAFYLYLDSLKIEFL